MTVRRQRGPRRGAANNWLMLVVGVVMLAVGVYIGTRLDGGSAGATEPQADAGTPTSTTDSSTTTVANRRAAPAQQQQPDPHAGHDHAQPAAPADRPATVPVEFDPPALDLGTVAPGELVSGTVNIRNVGSEPLLIQASRASCSCTAVDMSGKSIAPGESVPMETTFHKQSLGEKTAAVRLKFRGYDEILEVQVRATVARAVYAEPAFVYARFSDDPRKTIVHSGTFDVLSADKKPFRVLSVNGEKPDFVNYNPATDEPRNAYTLAWDLSDVDDSTCLRADGEPLRRFWIIETDHPRAPMFEVQVRHMCTLPEPPTGGRRWLAAPYQLTLGVMQPGESKIIKSRIRWLPRTPDRVREFEKVHAVLSESPHIKVDLVDFERESEEADHLTLRVTLDESAPEGILYEKIRVHSTSHSAQHVLLGVVRPESAAAP